jgi:hypothetical protein
LPADTANDRLLDDAAGAMGGSRVREVAFLALRNAILRDACDMTGLARPSAEISRFRSSAWLATERAKGSASGER